MSTRCTARCLALALFALAQYAPRVNGAQPSATGIDFSRQIRPLLSENCFACHGPDENKRKAKLRLDTKLGAFAPLRDGSFAIVPGKSGESRSEEHTSELQSLTNLVCRLLLEKKKKNNTK